MERTESRIIQVAPVHENSMIEEMQKFGWNLQGRQEMCVEGDTAPDLATSLGLSGNTQTHITKIKHYVKLHFVRSLDFPNLQKVKEIEVEYSNLPFPSDSPIDSRYKKLLKLPVLFGLLIGVIILMEFGFIVGIIFIVVAFFFLDKINKILNKKLGMDKKKEEVIKIREKSKRRAQELLVELKKLGCS